MLKTLVGMSLIVLVLWASPYVYGQKATEMFIPIGHSPGLSGYYTIVGTIESVNMDDQTITIGDSLGTYDVTIKESTKIWLDKSKIRSTNQTGAFEDCLENRVVEVKFEGDKRRDRLVAEWIKLQITEALRK